MRGWRLGAIIGLLAWCALGGTVLAEEGPAAILPMQGPQAAKVRQRVQTGLRNKNVPLVPLKKVTAVTKKTKGYAKQAARLGASVLVGGRVRRSDNRWIADVGIRNEKGVRVRKFRASASTVPRLSNRIVTLLMASELLPGESKADEGVTKLGAGSGAAAAAPKAEAPTYDTAAIVVRPFKGQQASRIRSATTRGFKGKPVELVPNKQFAAKANSLNADLTKPRGHVAPARALGVDALLEGDILREDGIWSAYVRLVDGKSSDVISQHYYEGESSSELASEVQEQVWDDFRKDINRFQPAGAVVAAPVAVEEPKKKKEKEPRKKKTRKPKGDRPAAVDVEFGFKFVNRNLTFNEDQIGNLRDYNLKFGPGLQAKFQYYPGAHFTSGVGAQFGIDFEWERLFNFTSDRDDGLSFPSSSQQFLAGLRWRYPAGRWEPSVFAGYGFHKFEFGVDPGPPITTAGIPGVRYQFARLGTGFRVGIGARESFIIVANIAFRGVVSYGGIASEAWFPDAKGNGMDALLMIGYALPKGFEIRIGGDYRRYWFDLNPIPPDPPYVAGGALDQYWGLSIGAAWRY
ncbi:MAG: hypothetical protein AAF997_04665 [Myxococcota bacterium]